MVPNPPHKKKGLIAETLFAVRMIGLEPTRRKAPDPKSGMATNYITSALGLQK